MNWLLPPAGSTDVLNLSSNPEYTALGVSASAVSEARTVPAPLMMGITCAPVFLLCSVTFTCSAVAQPND